MDIITIDGTASSGKSTVGFLFAKKIGYQFIDSGLIYRVGVLLAKRNNIQVSDGEGLAKALLKSRIDFKTVGEQVKVFLRGEDVTYFLKTPEIDQLVPIVAARKEVRAATKGVQREVGGRQNTVMAGRDIGSEIFPEARLKFFITASVAARAKRRYEQLVKNHPTVNLKDIEEEIKNRDRQDATRQASPMRVPENGIVIDTSDMNIAQVVEKLFKFYG